MVTTTLPLRYAIQVMKFGQNAKTTGSAGSSVPELSGHCSSSYTIKTCPGSQVVIYETLTILYCRSCSVEQSSTFKTLVYRPTTATVVGLQ